MTASSAGARLAASARTSLESLIAAVDDAGLAEASLGAAWKDRRGADLVAHIHAWHELFCSWFEAAERGRSPKMPAPGHTWDTLDALNNELYERFAATPWEEIAMLARQSRERMLALIEPLSDEALEDPGAYPWASGELSEIALECLDRHDDWARARLAEATAKNS